TLPPPRLLPRRIIVERVVLRERRVQGLPRRLLDRLPRRWPPHDHLTDPRVQHVTPMEERRSPAVLSASQIRFESRASALPKCFEHRLEDVGNGLGIQSVARRCEMSVDGNGSLLNVDGPQFFLLRTPAYYSTRSDIDATLHSVPKYYLFFVVCPRGQRAHMISPCEAESD